MPVIINDLEIVAEPGSRSGAGDTSTAASTADAGPPGEPPLSPSVIREILERATERGLRTFAH